MNTNISTYKYIIFHLLLSPSPTNILEISRKPSDTNGPPVNNLCSTDYPSETKRDNPGKIVTAIIVRIGWEQTRLYPQEWL